MLGQRLESESKAQTLPRLDGQDEMDPLDEASQFEILTLANSCPDLTILDPPEAFSENGVSGENNVGFDSNSNSDLVDGLFFKSSAPLSKIPLSFRRSSSLTSLTTEEYNETPHEIDGNAASVIQPGIVAKLIGACEENSVKVKDGQESNSGSGTLHKSVSTPSVTQIFAPSSSSVNSEIRPKHVSPASPRDPPAQTSFSQSQSYKRSFFRRKHKTKSNPVNSKPPVIVQHYRNMKMDGSVQSGLRFEDAGEESAGSIALSNPALGLQDPEEECWAKFMGEELVAQLDEKEVKRQEHMYELIITEKHHCLALALMHHLFVGGMKKAGYSRPARLIFPGLAELLHVHFTFLQRMRERQLRFRDMGMPLDTLADLINEQFSGEQWQQMVRLYGLLCASHKHSLDLFKSMQKESKFSALVNFWSKEPLLARKGVPECLLLVAQRITKYPLLFEPLYKTSNDLQEKEQITRVIKASKELNEKVNERVAERERLIEFCQKLDHKSVLQIGQKQVRKDHLTNLPSRRLLFNGLASAVKLGANGSGFGGSGGPGSGRSTVCNVLVLTDSLVFVQELGGGKYHFMSPPVLPGIVTLNNLILRENAGQPTSLFLVWNSLGSKADKPEMIELQVIHPPNRDKWVEVIRDASTKWQAEEEAVSDDEEFFSDGVDYPDSKTARALEELLEQDRQIMSLLRSRSKLVETLKIDKPQMWSANQCDGKDNVLNSISNACEEIQRMLHNMDSTALNGVNRSVSCAADHVTSGMLAGLPRRADTFGGFDSQQRSGTDSGSQSANNKVLFQMVIQLGELCSEMFQQMIPQLTPQISQSQHQLQRRMEDLREAQQRLETEKAEWQREFAAQKEEIDRQFNTLNTKAGILQNEEKDISEQREQLYRKLEALQRQGIRPALEAVSPISVSASIDKPVSVIPPPRRTVVSQVQIPPATPQVPTNTAKPPKQQIPHFLAHSSAVKPVLSPTLGTESPKPMPRTVSTKAQPPLPPNANNQSVISDYNTTNRSSQGNGPRGLPRGTSQPVQQLLPYRLMEGLKTSSLPRGVGSRSASSIGHSQSMDQQSVNLNSNSKLRNSSSSGGQVLHHSQSTTGGFAGDPTVSSYGVRPSTNDRMSSYYRNPNADSGKAGNGYMDNYNYGPNVMRSAVPIVHRRAGSSPVPMSSTVVNSNPAVSNHHRDDDFDMTNVLFL